MNIANLIIRLQKIAESDTDAFTTLLLSKAIEKLKVGSIRTVATYGDLPTLPLSEDGELFLVVADEDIYFNVGSTWDRFRPFVRVAYAWGRQVADNGGQIGDGTTIGRSSPVTVIGGITNWSKVSAGNFHSLGLTDTGVLYSWGRGSNGNLGDGNQAISRSSPATVVGGITNWSEISAATYGSHNLALTDTGVLYSWGLGADGELGIDDNVSKSSPVTVVGGITNWSSISAGKYHSLGVTADGIAYAWGNGSFGELGDGLDGTSNKKSSPITVIGGITNWSQVSGGNRFSIGLTDTGVAYAWGIGSVGRLGDGTTINRSSPVTVVGGITNWSQISAGSTNGLGLTDTGVLYAWGQGLLGALGDGTTIDKSSPVTVIGGITNWSTIESGPFRSFGITDAGILYGWGAAEFGGGLGDDTLVNKSSPITVIGGITNWSAVASGSFAVLAISSS